MAYLGTFRTSSSFAGASGGVDFSGGASPELERDKAVDTADGSWRDSFNASRSRLGGAGVLKRGGRGGGGPLRWLSASKMERGGGGRGPAFASNPGW